MTEAPPEVAILIVCHNGRAYIEGCLDSVLRSESAGFRRHVVVVDNASTDGTAELVSDRFPQIDCVCSSENRGFAGGNCLGWEFIRAKHPDLHYLVLLNQDVRVAPDFLGPLIETLEAEPSVACVQPKILLDPQTDRINTAGNRSHFLGFGFTTGYLEPDGEQFDQSASIDFASGAALAVRADLLDQVGLFDPMLFMYLEDAELGWKLRQLGYEIRYVPQSKVYHQYQFNRNFTWYYYLERNRLWLLLTYYRRRTLLLLLPAIVLMEFGQLLFSARVGRLHDKLQSWRFFLSAENRRRLRLQRRIVQKRRRCSDHEFMSRFSGKIESPELNGPLIRWIANPLLNAYWQIARRLIVW